MTTKSKPWILGIAASHNGAACLLHGNEIVCAIQEERLTRFKRDRVFIAKPSLSADYVLKSAKIGWEDLDLVVFCGQRFHEAGSHRQNSLIRNYNVPVDTISHHLGHAIGVYACSGFSDATVVVVDGNGSRISECDDQERTASRLNPQLQDPNEWATIYSFQGNTWLCLDKHVSMGWVVPRPDQMALFASLGGMYSASAQVVFGDFMSGAGKLMGLSAYGSNRWSHKDFFVVDAKGSFYWNHHIPEQFALGDEWPADPTLFADLAASTQSALNYGLSKIFDQARAKGSSDNLCYSGGVSLNTIFNNSLITDGEFSDVFILPAGDDAGTAIGAAYYGLWKLTGKHEPNRLLDDGLGRTYPKHEIDHALGRSGFRPETVRLEEVVRRLNLQGETVAWFEGGSEFGPRALGHRSILFDPRRKDAVFRLNQLKGREQFRPFAPSVLEEHAGEWFDLNGTSPFMLRSMPVSEQVRDCVPGILHIDGTSRPQTVSHINGHFYRLLKAWHGVTGVPMLLNTSFNGPEEPIVETPEHAVATAIKLGINSLCFPINDEWVYRVKTG